jgi:hypothetical protein
MTGHVQQRIDLVDGHALGIRRNLHDLVAGLELSLLKDAKIEAGSAVRDEQCGHLRLVHADADLVTCDARLRHFKHGAPDPIAIADAHLVVGQPFDGEILPELPIAEVASVEMALPIAIGLNLVNKDGPMLAAVPHQIPLTIALDVEPPRHPPALNGRLPNGGVDRLSLPRDIARQTNVDRKNPGRLQHPLRQGAAQSQNLHRPLSAGDDLIDIRWLRGIGGNRDAHYQTLYVRNSRIGGPLQRGGGAGGSTSSGRPNSTHRTFCTQPGFLRQSVDLLESTRLIS